MTLKKINVGIIGFGMIGKVHAFGYATLPFYAPDLPIFGKIKKIVTAHPETAERAKELTGAESSSDDYRFITEDPEIDIVHICTPNNQHMSPLLSAIENQKHIYCEKPLAVSKEDADKILDVLLKTKYNRTSQMTFHVRFYTAIQRALQLIREGRLGRIFQYRAGYFHSSNAVADTPFKWKQGDSGGVIRDVASHVLDLIDFLLGPPAEVFADSIIAYPFRKRANAELVLENERLVKITAEDSISILTRHRPPDAPEFKGIIEATKLATGEEDDLRFEINGEKGSLRFSLMNSHYLEFFDATVQDSPFGGTRGWTQIACGARYNSPDSNFPSAKATAGWVRGHVAALSHFLNAIAQGESGDPNLLQGCRIQYILDAVNQAAQTQKWIPIK